MEEKTLLFDKGAISPLSYRLMVKLFKENPRLYEIIDNTKTKQEARALIKQWAEAEISKRKHAADYYFGRKNGRQAYKKLEWEDLAIFRILDYVKYANFEYEDLNLNGQKDIIDPFGLLWVAHNHGVGAPRAPFFEDMIYLFRQFSGKLERKMPSLEHLKVWMARHPSGLDADILKIREQNKQRIIQLLIIKIEKQQRKHKRYCFKEGISHEKKHQLVSKWWHEYAFHLRFAIRKADELNEFLDYSLLAETLDVLKQAEQKGIPIFVNPYYLSLINTREIWGHIGADLPIRSYVLYSQQLINEFGKIVAWEKEDVVQQGEPNAAGWVLPDEHAVHRRYPSVAILIPPTVGRACAGLCSSCQRMYDFQAGNLNFNLDKLKPKLSWEERLRNYLAYWENDTKLQDILVTGGDALMSSNKSLQIILNEIYEMANRKRQANRLRTDGQKYAQIQRVRLGTRMPVYLPQRIDDELVEILTDFKKKASEIGVKQFFVQTHFETAMEITIEVDTAVSKLRRAGWVVTNQNVFTAAASRKGHTAKLRKVLNDMGIIPYYTFSVKGYMENYYSFATNARAVQEQLEEKIFGVIPQQDVHTLTDMANNPKVLKEKIEALRHKHQLPFLATDRNVMNLPGVGKSLTFKVIGITRSGRRILEFDHDRTREHSPIIEKMGKVVIVESKPISKYLEQMVEFGEDPTEYETLWGYSMGETEPLIDIYKYPEYDFRPTNRYSNYLG